MVISLSTPARCGVLNLCILAKPLQPISPLDKIDKETPHLTEKNLGASDAPCIFHPNVATSAKLKDLADVATSEWGMHGASRCTQDLVHLTIVGNDVDLFWGEGNCFRGAHFTLEKHLQTIVFEVPNYLWFN